MVPKPGIPMNCDDGFPAFDDIPGGEFSPQGVNDFFTADFTKVDVTPVTEFSWTEDSFSTPRPPRRAAASPKPMNIKTIDPEEAKTLGPSHGAPRPQRRREKPSPAATPKQQHSYQEPQPPQPEQFLTPPPTRQSSRTNGSSRRKTSRPREDVSASEQSAGEDLQLSRFLDFTQSEHAAKSFSLVDDEEEEKSIYSMFQWSVCSRQSKTKARDARSCDGDGFEDTPRRPRRSNRKADRETMIKNLNNSKRLNTSDSELTSPNLKSMASVPVVKKPDRKPLLDPKSAEAAKLRDLLLNELEQRVNAAGKKKKKAASTTRKREEMAIPSSEHSQSSLRKPSSSSKEYRRMHMKLSSSESQESISATPRERSPKTKRSSTRSTSSQDIHFQPNTQDNNRSSKKSLDIHFQRDDTPRPAPADSRSIFSSRSKMSQSESEESYRFQDDDGTVLQFDPTQEDHVAKRRIGRNGSTSNIGLGESLSSSVAVGVGTEVPQNGKRQHQRQQGQPQQQLENPIIPADGKHDQQLEQRPKQQQPQQVPKRRMSRVESVNVGKTKELQVKEAAGFSSTFVSPLPIEADAAAGVAYPDPPTDPAGFVSPAVTCTSKGSAAKKRGFFIRRRSNETEGDENNTICSVRSEVASVLGASASSRRLGVNSAGGGTSTRRGTSLSMLRRRSASSDCENDERSMVSNNTDTSNFRSRYSRRTSRRTGGRDHKRLLDDDDSDSDY